MATFRSDKHDVSPPHQDGSNKATTAHMPPTVPPTRKGCFFLHGTLSKYKKVRNFFFGCIRLSCGIQDYVYFLEGQ